MTATATATLRNYIGGEWTAIDPGRDALEVTNPATGEVLAHVPLSGADELDAAVAAARAALPAWRDVSTIGRARMLFELREGLEARKRGARPVGDQRDGQDDRRRPGRGGADDRDGRVRVRDPDDDAGPDPGGRRRGVDCETIRQPVGVCAAIVPFNFPAMVPFWFLPFAIGCGNAFILKPSEQVPLTQQIAFEVLDSIGLPPGVVSLVNGGREIVEGILAHPGIDAVSFVGSAPVAQIVYEGAAKAGKRVQALGGAKNHMVVMPDAVIDKTVDGIIGSAFGAAGQRCMAGSVVVTVGEAHERLMPALVERTRGLQVGDGLEDGTDVGPVVSCTARDRIAGWIERGVADGASLAVDGRAATGGLDPSGAFVGPTILDDVTAEMPIAQEEVFGPVLCVVQADTLEEAIEIVNASRFGNGTSIFTESGAAVRRYRHDVQAGMVGRQHRRRRAGRVLPVLGLEGQLPRRPPRPRRRRGRVLHAQEDRHQPLLLRRSGPRRLLRREVVMSQRRAKESC